MKKISIILLMAMTAFSFTALSVQSTKTIDKIATVDTVVYQCPMKCEGDKTYEKAGKCPTCNMALKATTKPVAAVYQCPIKCEAEKTYDKPGKCPKCNMNLTKVQAKKTAENNNGYKHN